MIDKMRKHMKLIFWIVVICFLGMIVFSWGMDITGRRKTTGSEFLGKVNGVEISYRQFQQSLEQIYQQQKSESGSEPDIDRLREQTWNEIVQQILLAQAIEQQKITVSNSQVIAYMRNNPPDIVRQQPTFQDSGGNFDLALYHEFLDNPGVYASSNTKQFLLFVQHYVSRSLQLQKLQSRIFEAVKVTQPEVKEQYADQNEKVRVAYIYAGPEMFRDIELDIDQQQIADYHNKNQKEFEQEEKRRCRFVQWEKKPSAADEEAVRIEAENVAAELREEADFAEMAKELSDDPGSAPKGGDLGWFSRGQMVEPFEKAAFALKTGQISNPVRTQYGWHVIKLIARDKENSDDKIKASHILLKVEPGRDTIEALREEAGNFIAAAEEEGFEIAAEARGEELKDTGFFAQDGYIPGIGPAQSLVDFTFRNKTGAISSVYENSAGLWVLQLQEKKEAAIRPLEEVEADIRSKLEQEQRREAAREKIAKAAGELEKGVSLEEAAKTFSLTAETSDLFTRSAPPSDFGARNQAVQTAFALQPEETSGVVSTERGFYVIKLLEKQPIDEADFQAQQEEIRQRLLYQHRYEAYTAWLTDLKEQAKIVDNRALALQ